MNKKINISFVENKDQDIKTFQLDILNRPRHKDNLVRRSNKTKT